MPNIRLTILKDKPAKGGSFKIRVALTHNHGVKYILTRFTVDNASQFKDGQVVKRANASIINKKLRSLLNEYQDKGILPVYGLQSTPDSDKPRRVNLLQE